ncbi:MAG: cyclic nucleotide-binding domain-containing protein [Proteobacteria bacterium]|nr:cyclic nucleotide-binding domain-containing protein [Pseudomonadota bacterium]
MTDLDERLEVLGDVPAFAALPDPVLRRLARQAEALVLPAGATLFEQGAMPTHLHVLLDGQVGLLGVGADGQTTVVEVLRPVDQFVLAAVLTDAPYLMAARTLEPVRLYLIDAATLRQLVEAEPQLAVAMIVSLSRHFRMLVRQVKDLKLRSTAQRLGCYLLELARQQGDPARLKLPYDKQLLAARLGTTPENLSRAFATLRDHGVRTSGATVSLGRPARLAEFAQPDEIPEG